MMTKLTFRVSISLAILVASLAAICFGQPAVQRGTVSGLVLKGGAPVPGIYVQVTSELTGSKVKTSTDKMGNYTVPNVMAGKVTASALDPDGHPIASNAGTIETNGQVLNLNLVLH